MNQTIPPTADQEPGDPEWLRQMRGWEDTPEWLRKLIRSNAPAPGPVTTGGPEAVPPDEGVPGTEALGAEAPEAYAADLGRVPERESVVEPDEFALPPISEDDPDWLAAFDDELMPDDEVDGILFPEMEGDDIPEWLRRMSPAAQASEAEAVQPAKEPPAAAERPSAAAELPAAAEEPPAAAEELPVVAEELPAAAEEPPAAAEERPAAAEERPAAAGLADMAPESTFLPSGEEEQEIPEWLRDLSPSGQWAEEDGQTVPEWLTELDRAGATDLEGDLVEAIGAPPRAGRTPDRPSGEGTPLPEEPAEDEEEIPDWLLGLAAETEQEAAREFAAESETEPDLEGAEAEAGEPGPLAVETGPLAVEPRPLAVETGPSMDATGPLSPVEQEEFPAWLLDMAEQAPPDEEEFLIELQGEADEGMDRETVLPTLQDIVGGEPEGPVEEGLDEEFADAAEWLYAVEEEPPPQEPLLTFAEGELPQEEMPEWVDELRVPEPDKAALDAVVETSGPLAGLSGLLNPDTLFGITHKAEYTALPPVPNAQQEQARLLRTFLAAPPKRPDIAPLPVGQATMASLGRWVIYVALLAAICVAIFSPALRELIEPAQTVEAQAFFDAVRAVPQGSEVLMVVDYDASHDGELTPQTRAVLWHLMKRDLGVILVSHTPQGAAIVDDLVRGNFTRSLGQAYVAGQHYLNLGYMPPHAASMQAFMANPLGGVTLWGASQTEAVQTPLGQRVARFEDLDLILVVSSNQDHVRWWVEQTAATAGKVGIVAGLSASAAPYLLPYYEGGGIGGLLVGLAGAAEYEQLVGARFVPNARENLILMGCAQLLLAAIVLASGIRSVFGRSKGA